MLPTVVRGPTVHRSKVNVQRAKSSKMVNGGVYFYCNGTQNCVPLQWKYTSPLCFFSDFARWVATKSLKILKIIVMRILVGTMIINVSSHHTCPESFHQY